MRDIVPRRSSGLSRVEERQQDREVETVSHVIELAELEVAGIGRITNRAMAETMRTAQMRKLAEQVAPDGAELYAMIAVAGAMASTEVVAGLTQRLRRRSR